MIRKKRKVCLYIHLPDTQFIRSVYPLSVCLSTYLAFRLSKINIQSVSICAGRPQPCAQTPASRQDQLLSAAMASSDTYAPVFLACWYPPWKFKRNVWRFGMNKNFNSDEDPWSPAEKGRVPGRQGSLSAGSTPR